MTVYSTAHGGAFLGNALKIVPDSEADGRISSGATQRDKGEAARTCAIVIVLEPRDLVKFRRPQRLDSLVALARARAM